jgi:hypothetical protein
LIAGVFHFPPATLWKMDAKDLRFWVGRAQWFLEHVGGR